MMQMAIKRMRKRRLMTTSELSLKSGVSRVSICRYETGKREPKLSDALRIAKALDCSVEELMEETAPAGADS